MSDAPPLKEKMKANQSINQSINVLLHILTLGEHLILQPLYARYLLSKQLKHP